MRIDWIAEVRYLGPDGQWKFVHCNVTTLQSAKDAMEALGYTASEYHIVMFPVYPFGYIPRRWK